jgi:hypothetical protein
MALPLPSRRVASPRLVARALCMAWRGLTLQIMLCAPPLIHRRRGLHSDLRGMNSTPTVEYCLQDIYRILKQILFNIYGPYCPLNTVAINLSYSFFIKKL